MRKYPELYARIKQYKYLVVTEVFCLPEHLIDSTVCKDTDNAYARCCRLINQGLFSEDELLSQYPI